MTQREKLFSEINFWHEKPYELYETTEAEMRKENAKHPRWSDWEQKAYGYSIIAEKIGIKLFPSCPFSFEINSRRNRGESEFSGLPSWHKRLPAGVSFLDKWISDTQPFIKSGIAQFYKPVDDTHHTLDYETILQKGLYGILEEITRREYTAMGKQSIFLKCMKSGIQALIRLCERFYEEAMRISHESHGDDQKRMLALASAIKNAPMNPAKTFHEALNTVVFMYFAVPALEGNDISVLGHIDRLLYPYLLCDLKNRVITEDEAYDLLWRFLALHDARFGFGIGRKHTGVNVTVVLGGCDNLGIPVYNTISSMVIKASAQFSLVEPKLNIRISKDTDPAFLMEVATAQSKRTNNIAVFNDDVIIPANVSVGKALEDARLYVGGGCQENVISHCEINNRATVYMNNLAPLLAGFFPDKYIDVIKREGQSITKYDNCKNFEDFYNTFIDNTRSFNLALINMKNRYESNPLPWCASPVHSAFLGDCIIKASDMFLGGARYSYDSVSQGGIATIINSLMAIKILVYDNKEITLAQLADILKTDFEGFEVLRCRIINRLPKFGQEDFNIRELSAKVFSDLAKITTGIPNARGGLYEASLFSHASNIQCGIDTGATPDGRKNGNYFSQGMSPSVFTISSIPQVFNVLKSIDLTAYPVVAVLDFKLPPTEPEVIAVIYKQFVKSGGSVLQLNIFNLEELEDALLSPEKYPDLVVRMRGYSAHFIDLTHEERQEVVNRAVCIDD